MKIAKVSFLLALLAAFLLSGCAGFPKIHDPDGDGDFKGNSYFPATRPATGNRVFIYDPTAHAWAGYNEEGKRENTGRASGGKLYCSDIGRECKTTAGSYQILSKGDVHCYSSKYPVETNGGAPMPYCMYFSPKGFAIHGVEDVPDYYNSHGCIGVTVDAAKWLNENFLKIGSTVIVEPY